MGDGASGPSNDGREASGACIGTDGEAVAIEGKNAHSLDAAESSIGDCCGLGVVEGKRVDSTATDDRVIGSCTGLRKDAGSDCNRIIAGSTDDRRDIRVSGRLGNRRSTAGSEDAGDTSSLGLGVKDDRGIGTED